MSRFNERKNFTWQQIVKQCIAVIILTAGIVAYLPRESSTSLHYEVGRPWPYLRFIAPCDFPIFKSEAQLQKEQDSILRLYQPYFEYQPAVEHRQTEAALQMLATNNAGSNAEAIKRTLHHIYEQGVVSNADWEIIENNKSEKIRVYQFTKAISRSSKNIFNQKNAYSFLLTSSDSIGISKKKLQTLNLDQYISPNLKYDNIRSEEYLQTLQNSLTPTSGVVMEGQSVIDNGDIVSNEQYQILQSYEHSMKNNTSKENINRSHILGHILFVTIVLVALLLYFNLFRRDYITSNLKSINLVVMCMLFFVFLTSFLMRHTFMTVYLIPYAMFPIFVRSFMDSRTAFISHVTTILLAALAVHHPYEFIATQTIAGLVGIYSLRDLNRRAQIFQTAFVVTITAIAIHLSIDLMEGHLLQDLSISSIDWNIYKHLLWSGIILLLSYPLMFLIERVFGFISNVTLLELSNFNQGLLRKLSEEAPGTWQHSTQVGNLATAVAEKIGGDGLLVRTGALYHDIGKIAHPSFFTENRENTKPNTEYDDIESANIIKNHVVAGAKMAEAKHLPQQIIDFITTHHGKGIVKYFYVSYQNKHPDEAINKELFSYAGPNPFTKEQAILMMADAVEAACRSIDEYTKESIFAMVDNVINSQRQEGLFDNSPITFHDITKAREVLKEKLLVFYHNRIKYPETPLP